jgi:acyl-ACP thioesterase
VYEYQLQIGICHVGKNSLLKLGPAIDILQNATWFQLDTETAFVEYFRKNSGGMFLISRQLDIKRLPAYGEQITARSWITNCDRLFGYRNTAIYDAQDRLCIGTYAIGTFADLKRMAPSRIPQELLDQVKSYPALDMEMLPRKIPVPPEMIQLSDTVRVQEYHLDNYGHMNNARYVDIASAYIPDSFSVRRIRLEYKNMALCGDLIIPHFAQIDEQTLIITLNGEDGKIFSVMEFTGKPK